MYKININSSVKFKLTELGEEVLRVYDEDTKEKLKKYGIISKTKRKTDENGFYLMQLWKVMRIFGEGCSVAKDPPFVKCELLIEEKDVKKGEI